MTKAMWGMALGLGIVLSLATAHAQGLEDPNAINPIFLLGSRLALGTFQPFGR